ncbi:MAG: hypothetical protein RPR97_01080 [Colwellia sp.]|jgi:hypothetical protein
MAALTGNSALSRRKDNKNKKITTVASKRNTTTGTSPIPIRLTPTDKAEVDIWLNELTDLAGKKISLAKLIRGITFMRDKIKNEKLLEAIKKSG